MNFYEKEPVSLYLDELEILENIITAKQKVKIYRHPFLGLILVINDEIQHIERYQCLYHEMLVHLPISFCAEPKTALILGGGSLFAAHEILKYPSIEKILLCDHDHLILDLMEKYYLHAKMVRKDSRFHYLECDGIAFIQTLDEKYDIIINDCFNLLNESCLNAFSLYEKMSNMLTSEGVCADIIYRHIFDGSVTHDSIQKLKETGNMVLSLVAVPEYPGILHVETIWGKNPNISQDSKFTYNFFQKQYIGKEKSPFCYFSPENIPFYLYLPPYVRNIL